MEQLEFKLIKLEKDIIKKEEDLQLLKLKREVLQLNIKVKELIIENNIIININTIIPNFNGEFLSNITKKNEDYTLSYKEVKDNKLDTNNLVKLMYLLEKQYFKKVEITSIAIENGEFLKTLKIFK